MDIESQISPLIESMFPEIYQEEGPMLIGFIKAYFEYLESQNQVTHHSRNLLNYRDIDSTLDEFILHFKEKYLKNIQFDIATNKQLLVKHSLDLYRSKGTERAIDLFFKLVYGIDADVYYPGDDIFKLSDGEYVRPRYLEITTSARTLNFVGKQITGASSGATAFVEKYIKRKIKTGEVHILYVSNIAGEFDVDEAIYVDIIYNDLPKIIGSLNKVEVITGGKNFAIGDIVNFVSSKGINGQGIVSKVSDETGIVDFLFLEGGYGYTLNAESIVSEKLLTANGITFPTNTEFKIFENIIQPLANVEFISANATLSVGDLITSNSGTGKIISVTQSGANGSSIVSVTSGQFIPGESFTDSFNTKTANVNTSTGMDAVGKLMHAVDTANIILQTIPSQFIGGSNIYQSNSTVEFANATISLAANSTLVTTNVHGTFNKSFPLRLRGSNSNATIVDVAVDLGIYNIANTFMANGAYIYGEFSNSYGFVNEIGSGFGAGFDIGTIGEVETIFINTDLIGSNNVGFYLS